MSDLELVIEAREAARSGRGTATREAAGLSRAELARAAGLNDATVSRYESGRRVPQGDSAIRYARILRKIEAKLGARAAA